MSDENIRHNLIDIVNEYNRAVSMFSDFKNPHEGYATLLEEVDELWDEIKGNKKPGAIERMRKEAVQVAAMALRFLVMLDEMQENSKVKS
jgi:NTP pyrophosphatase (non-canonical NTP hydrolase)